METKHELISISKGFILGSIVILGMSAIAWNGPVSAPPNYNAYAPINVSLASQTKSGALWAGSFLTEGGGYFGGNVGIGTSNPSQKLSVVGNANVSGSFSANSGSVANNLSANTLQLNSIATEGSSCSPNGLQAIDSTGKLLSCSSGVWTASSNCSWVVASNTTTASCPANQHAVAGGCYAGTYNDRGLVESTPLPVGCTGDNCTGWYCLFSNSNATVSIRCCSN